jgi:hypothetical protein
MAQPILLPLSAAVLRSARAMPARFDARQLKRAEHAYIAAFAGSV